MGKAIRNNDWNRVLAIIIPYALIVGFFQFIAYQLLGISIDDETLTRTEFQHFILSLFTTIGTFLTIWLFRKYVDGKSFKSLGFSLTPNITTHFYLGFGSTFAIMLAAFLGLLLFNELKYVSFKFIFTDFLLSIGIFILVSLTEEVLIRGYVLANLMSSINKHVALIVSAIIFAAMHLANPSINFLAVSNLVLAGILLGLPYIYTKNLWFSIAFHFGWNFFQGTIFGFNVSGINGYSIITQNNETNNIWNGGDFGFEGSIVSIAIQIILIAIMYLYFIKYYKPITKAETNLLKENEVIFLAQ